MLNGQTPAKKNSRIGIVRNGRMMNFPSKIYQAWEKDALQYLASFYKGTADGPVAISCEFYNKDKRGRDIDNQVSSCLDVLVKAGLLPSDSCFAVPEIHAYFRGVDKLNPRAEVTIVDTGYAIDN